MQALCAQPKQEIISKAVHGHTPQQLILDIMHNGWRSVLHNSSSLLLSIMRTGWRSALHNKSSSLLSIMHNGWRSAHTYQIVRT